MSEQELIGTVSSILGLSSEHCRTLLEQAGWNPELAIANYFDNPQNQTGQQPQVQLQPQSQLQSQLLSSSSPNLVIEPPPIGEFLSEIRISKSDKKVPLQGIAVEANILNFVADVTLKQRFVNVENQPIEAVYLFRQDECAIYSLSVTIDEHVIHASIEEHEEAQEKYSDSISKGFGAYLLEKGIRDDIYQMSIGNLPPGKECLLTVKYVTELEIEGESLKFALPIARTELLIPSETDKTSENKEKIQGLNVLVHLQMSSKITNITSKNHEVQSFIEGSHATVQFESKGINPQKEFVLTISLEDPHTPSALFEVFKPKDNVVEKEKKTITNNEKVPHAVMISLFPHVQTEEDIITEVIFLVDRSGSMAGSKMNQTKNALQIFLRSLPLGTYFNIIGFGSRFEKLFSAPVCLTDDTLQYASNHVNSLDASLGGTEILQPLQDILGQPPTNNLPRQLFILTDGEVNNTTEVLQFTKNNVGNTRIFSLGIGGEFDRTLVAGLAKYGHGKAEFVQSGQRLEAPVMRQVKKALQPILRNISVDWGELPVIPRKVPYSFPPIFDGEKFIIYEFVQNDKSPEEINKQIEVKVKATTGSQIHEWRVNVNLVAPHLNNNIPNDIVSGELVHRLTARSIIKDLEAADSKQFKNEIVRLGKSWSLVTSYTSFVVEEKRTVAITEATKFVDVNKALKEFVTIKSPGSEELEELASDSEVETALSCFNNGPDPVQSFLGKTPENVEKDRSSQAPQRKKSRYIPFCDEATSFNSMSESKTNATENVSSIQQPKPLLVSSQPQQFPYHESPDQRAMPRSPTPDSSLESAPNSAQDTFSSGMSVSPPGSSSPPTSDRAESQPLQLNVTRTFSFGSTTRPKSTNTQQRPIDQIILLQKANGSFPLNELAELIGHQLTTLQSKLPEIIRKCVEAETLWATALAIAVLEVRFAEFKDEWEMLATKARKFLQRELKKENIHEINILIDLAKKALD